MHSVLDVTAGFLYGLILLIFVIPLMDHFDAFVMKHEYSLYVLFPLGFALAYSYPTLKRWSTTRKDTVITMGTCMGFLMGSCLNHRIGLIHQPDTPPLYDINYPDALGWFNVFLRTALGMAVLLATKIFFMFFFKHFLCLVFNQDRTNPDTFRKKLIELPLYYFTYFLLGINVTFTSPYIFRLLGIERDYSFTEI